MDNIKRIKELVVILNEHRDAYYNKQTPTISDYEYDALFDALQQLELQTGVILSNSPTVSVGFEVKSELEKVKHTHAMLSLDKTKSVSDLQRFADDKQCLLSLKLDGLTLLLTYNNGKLIRAETRGNGEEGEIVTHNAKVFDNIPLYIDYQGYLEVEGEAIITYEDFEKINSMIEDSDNKYKNPRNLASGSVRQLDSEVASRRHLKFIAWKVPTNIDNYTNNDSYLHKLKYVQNLGFDIVPLLTYANSTYDEEHIDEMIESLRNYAKKIGYPIDGLVMTYNDIEYSASLGATSHHPKHSIAFKFTEEVAETTLRYIDWTLGKTGQITPTAVFEPVEIDGTIVEKASVHNISILTKLDLHQGDVITVYKANQIIPQVLDNLSANERRTNQIDVDYIQIPSNCPICGADTTIRQDNESKVLICNNENCKGKLLGKLTHFVSKNAMNIDGLSEATLEKFIELGWVSSFKDIFTLKDHFTEMVKIDGFGEKSVNKLLKSIEKSKDTSLDRFIYSLCIPLVGKSASKTIAKHFDYTIEVFLEAFTSAIYDWSLLEDFGANITESINKYALKNAQKVVDLSKEFTFTKHESNGSTIFSNMVFVITGSLNHFSNRDEAKEKIESLGGKVSGSVSTKTTYLINNDINSNSGKNKKAKELGVEIITEENLIEMINNL